MISQPRDGGTDRVRARRKAAEELFRLRRGYGPVDDRRRKRVIPASQLVDASAVIIRLRPYRHLLDWGRLVESIVELLTDELPDDISRWILQEADAA